MKTKTKTRKQVIEDALGTVYTHDGRTKGTMIEALAKHLDAKWDEWESDEDYFQSFHHRLTLECWSWFPGGGTAEIAANKVCAAVKAMD